MPAENTLPRPGENLKKARICANLKPAGIVLAAALALTGCAHTRFVQTYCLTRAQYEQLKAQQPPKVHGSLTGQADRDTQILAGSLIRVRAYSDGLLTILAGCVESSPK
jgi:hypothetical protein